MPDPSLDATPTPARPGLGWVGPAVAGLGGLLVVASGLHYLLDDDRLRFHTAFLWPMAAALLIVVASRGAAPAVGPSPWTPTLLRVLAVVAGLAGGLLLLAAGLSGSPQNDPSAAPLALTLAALVLGGCALVLVVLVGAGSRGLSWRAPLLPGLSATDRRRARDTAAAPVASYCAAVLLAPWSPPSPLLWVPAGVAFATGLVLWAWWVTRLASTRD